MNPFPSRRVVVPVDFTPVSRAAWSWARVLGGSGGRLDAVYVHEVVSAPVIGLTGLRFLTPREKRSLLDRMTAAYPGCRAHVVEGPVVGAILKRARGADLVVMGSHGKSGLRLALEGSISESVVRGSPVPVLTVKSGYRPVRSILAPVNLTRYSRLGLRAAAEAAARFDARMTVLHVNPDRRDGANARFFLSGMLDRLPEPLRRGPPPAVLLEHGKPIPTILAESRHYDLLVLTAHSKSLLNDVVLGTTAERVLRHCRVPVLSVPSGRGVLLI